jgi:hypothetical protein
MLLPKDVYLLCKEGALLTGSRAYALYDSRYNVTKDTDYDLIVPFEHWQTITQLIPKDAERLSIGGFTFKDREGNAIDIFPDSVLNYLNRAKVSYDKNIIVVVDYINDIMYTRQRI